MRDKINKIHNIDCLEFMKQVPDNYFDLVLTDPPYGINIANKLGEQSGKQHKNNLAKKQEYKQRDWDKKIPSVKIFEEIQRVSKNAIIFGGNYFASSLPNSSCWIVWDKDNGNSYFADSELAWTNFGTAVRNYKFRWNGMLQQDMMNKEKRYHPTQKPIELFKMILRDYAIKLEKKTVFDPFIGSGTTALACKSLGIDWCGCELEADYAEIARKRLEAVQGSLL